MKIKYTIASSLLMTLAFTGCQNSDDVISSEILNLEPEYVKFAADQQINSLENATRTAYAGKDADGYVINWSANDQISIFCPEAEGNKSHTYKIKTHGSKSSDLQATSTEALKWNQARSNHNFYAVYPGGSDKATFSTDGDVVTLSLLQNETRSLETSSGDYDLTYDMSYAYMVAKSASTPTSSTVNLTFDPIMTTYDFAITNTSSEDVRVFGVMLKLDNSEGYIKDGKFQYDIVNNRLVKYSSGTNEIAYLQMRFTCGNECFIVLKPGKKIKLTMFLPPVDISSAKPVEVFVNANFEYSKTFQINNTIKSSRTAINVKLEKGGSGWIGLLDDDIYASQLSLPGASWAGCNTPAGTFAGHSIQGMNIKQLWENGVRVFDLHGDDYTRAFQVNSDYDNVTAQSMFNTLSDLLNQEKYAKEFAIIIIRQDANKTKRDYWSKFASSYWASDKCVEFKADATIKDLRKKILVLALDWGSITMPKFSGNFATDQWPGKYAISYLYDWYTYSSVKYCNIVSKSGATSGVYVSDWVKLDSDYQGKVKLIYDHLQNAKNMSEKEWSIMQYASCINSTWNSNNFASATGAVSVDAVGYYGGSYENGQSLISKVGNGPSGIILFPFVGLRNTSSGTGSYHPNCDKMVSYQIQRNFVNQLKQKPRN